MGLMDLNSERKAFCAMSLIQYDSLAWGGGGGYDRVCQDMMFWQAKIVATFFQMGVGYIYFAISVSLLYPFVHLNYFVVQFPQNTRLYNNCEEMWNSAISSHNQLSTSKC